MNLIEKVRALFATTPTVDSLEAAEADLVLALDAAKAASADRWQLHNRRALEFVSSTDPTAANRSRAKCDEADQRVSDLTAALKDVRERLERARKARSASDAASAWAAFRSSLAGRSDDMAGLQRALVEVAVRHRAVLNATESAWQSLPVKPSSRPPTFTDGDLAAKMQLFLHGASDGKLGAGTNAFKSSQLGDLMTWDHEAKLMLLAPMPRAAEAETQ